MTAQDERDRDLEEGRQSATQQGRTMTEPHPGETAGKQAEASKQAGQPGMQGSAQQGSAQPTRTGAGMSPEGQGRETSAGTMGQEEMRQGQERRMTPRVTIVNDECVEVEVMEAKSTAIGSVVTEELGATRSALGNVRVTHDASVTKSGIGMMSAENAVVQKGGVGFMKVDGDGELHQGGTSLIVAHRLNMDSSGAGAVMATKATAARSWIGVLAAGKVHVEDDSKVLIDMRAGLIIGAAVLGGFGILGAMMMGRRRGMMSRMNPMRGKNMLGMRTGMLAGLMGMLGMRRGPMRAVAKVAKADAKKVAKMASIPAVTGAMSGAMSRMRHSV